MNAPMATPLCLDIFTTQQHLQTMADMFVLARLVEH